MLEPEQIVGWASSQEQKKKKAAEEALARGDRPSYGGHDTQALERELKKRGIRWGRKRDAGKRELLKKDDAEREREARKDSGGDEPTAKRKRRDAQGGARAAKNSKKSKKAQAKPKRGRVGGTGSTRQKRGQR